LIKVNQMKGFILRYKNEEIKIAAKDDLAMIHVYELRGETCLSIAYGSRIWYDNLLDIGDNFEVELAEIEDPQPTNVVKKSKLEMFLEFENDLKKRGLL